MNAALQQRLRFIDFLLDFYGTFNRQHLMDYFGISTPQASADIARYIELWPSNTVYDKTARAYVKTPTFVRHYE